MIDVIGVPFDLTSRRGGTTSGPEGLIHSGLVPSLEKRGHNVSYVNLKHLSGRDDIFDGVPYVSQNAHCVDDYISLVPLIGRQVGKALIEGSTPLIIGGDRSVCLGSIGAAIHRDVLHGERLGLVWMSGRYAAFVDKTEHVEQIARMQLALLLGHGDVRFRSLLEKHSIFPDHVMHIGAATQHEASPEKAFLLALGVPHFSEVCITKKGWYPIFTALFDLAERVDRLWITLDLSVVRAQDAPAASPLRKEGGLTRDEILILGNRLSHTEKVIGANIVGLNACPDHCTLDGIEKTARLAIEFATQLMK